MYNNSHMNQKHTIKYAILHAVGVAAYVAGVAGLITYSKNIFGETQSGILMGIAMLLLLVVSAAITGSLIFARPITWYLNGNKKESIKLALLTIAFIALIASFAFIILALMAK
jgi:hypothetical protein